MNSDESIVFVRFSGDTRKAMSRVEMVKTFLESKDKMASMIQAFVPSNSKGGLFWNKKNIMLSWNILCRVQAWWFKSTS